MAEDPAEASTSQATTVQQGPRTRRQKRLAEESADRLSVNTRKVYQCQSANSIAYIVSSNSTSSACDKACIISGAAYSL